MKLTKKLTSRILEAAIFAEGKPISAEKLRKALPRGHRPPLGEIRGYVDDLIKHYQNRGVQLVEVASGYRFQINEEVSEHLVEQQEEKPLRMSKAFMETLALVAYRQPITRGEIEDIRGVAVSTNIIKSLQELEWVREVGHKDVPGKPALFATTKKFLDFFNLKALGDLPPLAQLQELSETKMQEEFEQLNLDLKNEMTEDERKQAELARLAREATLSPNFVGPRLPEEEEAPFDESQIDLAVLNKEIPSSLSSLEEVMAAEQTEVEVESDVVEQQQSQPLEAMDSPPSLEVSDRTNEDMAEELESLEGLEEQEHDQSTSFSSTSRGLSAGSIGAESHDCTMDESTSSIIDNALQKMRENLETNQDQDDNQDQALPEQETIVSELKDEEQDVEAEPAKNHKPLEGFTDIVLSSTPKDIDDDNDQEVSEDG